jgi:hypothetical protein
MSNRTQTADTSSLADLIKLLGPEQAAAMSNPTAMSIEAIDAFGERLAGMTDDQLRAHFHASDDLIVSMRELHTTCGF